MRFDWDILKPGRVITEAQKSVVEEIGLSFLNNGTGTHIHKKKVALGSERTILNDLEQLGLIRNHWNHYYPTFPALYFLPHSIRDGYAGYLHYIFQAIKALYENLGPARLPIEEVELQTRVVLGGSELSELAQSGLDAIYFNQAVSFLRDFRQSVMTEDSQKPESPVGAVIPMEQMIDYVDLQQAWERELSRRRPAYMDATGGTPSSNEANPTVRTALGLNGTDIVGRREGWETVGKPLGAGGQSTVYLVRRPSRLNAKATDIEKISSFSPWGTSMADTHGKLTEEFAGAVADLGRNDSPTELGALKEFKLRNDEQQAIGRLTQEVQILGEGRPGLPKLLDSNLNERWMVTEYFPHGTLEDNLKICRRCQRRPKGLSVAGEDRRVIARAGHRSSRHKTRERISGERQRTHFGRFRDRVLARPTGLPDSDQRNRWPT